MQAQHEPQPTIHIRKLGTRYSVLGTLSLVLCLLPTLLSASNSALAQDNQNRAGLVLQFPDGITKTYCIPFEGDSISGLDLLLKSGLPVKVEAYGGLGAEICQIGDTGCPYPDQPCACQSYGPGGVYWSYHHLINGTWKTSIVGAGGYRVHNGDVEGWAWSDGKPPALYSFSQLCPAIQPPSIPTDTPIKPTPTEPIAPTPTTRRPPPTHTLIPEPISTPTSPAAQPTNLPATQPPSTAEPPTTTPTGTTQPTSTPTAPPTSTATSVPLPTHTPTPHATPTIPNPQSPIRNEDAARTTGLVIGGLALGSLAVWAAVTAIRRSRVGGGNVE